MMPLTAAARLATWNFGFIGATLGHLFMGFDLTILSMIALLGLAGIVVNDSIVLIITIDGRRADGDDAAAGDLQSADQHCRLRFRPWGGAAQ